MERLRIPAAVGLAAVLVAACSSSGNPSASAPPPTTAPTSAPSAAAPGSAALDAVCAKGVQEGAVTIWIDIDPDEWAKETAPFTQKYPQIKITQSAIRPTDSVPRVITDVTAGRPPETDAVQGEAATLDPLVQRHLIDTSFDWTTFGQPASSVLNGMLRHYRTFRSLGYNTQTVKASDLPKTWDQLIDPKWKGQVIVDPRGYTFQDLGVVWGEQKTLDYVRQLKATDQPIVMKGITDGTVAVAGGQAKLTTNVRDAETNEQKSKGAPFDITYMDYVIVDDSFNAVVKGAQHPNAAACLVAWLNTPEALDLQYQQEFKKNDDTNSAIPSTAQLINIDTPEKASLDSKIAKEVAKIWAGK